MNAQLSIAAAYGSAMRASSRCTLAPTRCGARAAVAFHSTTAASTSSSSSSPPSAPTAAPAGPAAPKRQAAEEKGHPKPIRPYSQLQRNVLALYRKAYRLIRTKPEETQYHFLLYLRHAFKHPSQGGSVSKRDFSAIEHLLRKGERMVDQIFADRGVRDVHLPKYVIDEVLAEQARRTREREQADAGS